MLKTNGIAGTAVGAYAETKVNHGTAFGFSSKSEKIYSVALGYAAKANETYSVSVGCGSESNETLSIALGYYNKSNAPYSIAIGAKFTEITDSGDVDHTCITEGTGSITIGAGANTLNTTTTVDGVETTVESSNSVTIGCKADNKGADSVVIGASATGSGSAPCVVLGAGSKGSGKGYCVAIGTLSEARDNDIAIGHNSIIQGGQSIGIGYDTKNNAASYTTILGAKAAISNTTAADGTVTKSENTTVIGYGAKASASNAVVLGAGASTAGEGTIIIGAGTTLAAGTGSINDAILIGRGAKSTGQYARGSICIGHNSSITGDAASAIGASASAEVAGYALGNNAKAGTYSTAIGFGCVNKNTGTTSIKQTFVDYTTNPRTNYATQFYIMGANSPLAVQYEDGEACMGYVVKNEITGEILAAGTQKLSVLFPNNSTFQPATIDENGEWVMPKVFHPSDLDLPIEEPSENNDVEINIPTIETPIEEEYKPLPIYPIVELTIDEITE